MTNSSSKQLINTTVYKAYNAARKIFWKISGGRKEVVFGQRYYFEPTTHFPAYFGLRLPAGEIFSTSVRYGDYVQTHSAFLFLEELTHPPIVVDVGAHHGVYAILLGKLVQQKKGKIIAIEPNRAAFDVLKENVRLNGLEDTVICENDAIMERAGTVRFVAEGEQSRVVESNDLQGLSADAVPLSSLLKKYSLKNVDMMIIDVEGAELGVLRSIDWKSTTVKRIFCELHPYNWKSFGYTGDDVSKFLKEHNLRCFDMYLREHTEFSGGQYLGPTLFVAEQNQ